jgi:FKBP-type peptidyl-prolyl cis-trans isomerase
MPVGSTYRFYIPPQLGYGMLDSGPIPAASVLIFKIELLGIE